MSTEIKAKRPFLVLGRILILAALVVSVVLSGKFTNFMQGYGLLFVLLGAVAMALMGFSLSEIGAGFKHAVGVPGGPREIRTSATFWESSARNVWMLGVLGSIINFVAALSNSQGGIAAIASRMAISLVPTVYGMVLGVICMVPAWKLTEELHYQSPQETQEMQERQGQKASASSRVETLIGYILFIGMTTWAVIRPSLIASSFPFVTWEWIVYWPALLVVLGGTIALVLFVGNVAAGPAFTLSFALTALIGSLMGFIQVLLGFASKTIQDVASALTFVISSCFIGLLGMMLVGAPLEDRMAKAGWKNKQSALSRVAWYAFPLVTLIFLVLAFVLVITPIKKG